MKTRTSSKLTAVILMTLGAAACAPELSTAEGTAPTSMAAKADMAAPITESALEKSFIWNGYAYVIRSWAISVVSLQNPGQLVSRFAFGQGCNPWRMAAKGSFLFVATECGTPVLDVSNPASIRQVASLTTTPGAASRYLRVSGDRLYLSEYWYGWNFQVHDVGDPANPVKLGELRLPGTASNAAAVSAALSADHVAVHAPGAGVLVLDVRNPQNMFAAGTVPSPASGLVVKGTLLYLLRGGSLNGGWAGSVEIWDLTSPASPVRLGQRNLDRIVSDWDNFTIAVRNGQTFLFCGGDDGAYEQDFISVNVTDPRNPGQPVLVPIWISVLAGTAVTAADIDVLGSYAWVYGWKVPMEPWIGYEYYLVKVDISDPAAPVIVQKTKIPPFAAVQQ